ncbi:MAG TPA: hypothetical protein VF190_15340 [Rhodothermales bacterium]
MTAREWEAAQQFADYVFEAAHEFRLDPALIFAVMSRESHCGLTLDKHGTGDYKPRPWLAKPLPPDGLGWGRSVMQVDYGAHAFARGNEWKDPRAAIAYGTKVLKDSINYFHTKAADVAEPFRAGVAAYNRGPRNILNDIRAGLDIDQKTARGEYKLLGLHSGDYSTDVLGLRLPWFRERLGEMSDPDLIVHLNRLPVLPPVTLPVEVVVPDHLPEPTDPNA